MDLQSYSSFPKTPSASRFPPSLAQIDHRSRTPYHLRWAPRSGQSANTGSSTQPAHCTKIAQNFPNHSLPPLHTRLRPRGFGDLPLRPGVSRYAVLAGLGAAPDTELRAHHHGQFPTPGAHSGGGGGGGPASFLPRWRRWAAVPGNGPARVNRERATRPGRGRGGPGACQPPRSSRRGDARAGRVGAVLAVPPSRFVRVYSDISLGASLSPRRAVILHP